MLSITVQTQQTHFAQVRIVPRVSSYVVKVIYECKLATPAGNPDLMTPVDMGVGNLAALTSNKRGFIPRLVNSRPSKSTNQFHNKRRAAVQEALGTTGTTARMDPLTTKRTRRINHYLRTASHAIPMLLVQEGISTLVMGTNPGWKQEANLGRVNHQHFVHLPHARFIQMLTYKAQLAHIRVIVQEEHYTSKASG